MNICINTIGYGLMIFAIGSYIFLMVAIWIKFRNSR
jgi:hypothetical protein